MKGDLKGRQAGDLQGINGDSLTQIEAIEMPALEAKPAEGEQPPSA